MNVEQTRVLSLAKPPLPRQLNEGLDADEAAFMIADGLAQLLEFAAVACMTGKI